jgi:hypothetical protein
MNENINLVLNLALCAMRDEGDICFFPDSEPGAGAVIDTYTTRDI